MNKVVMPAAHTLLIGSSQSFSGSIGRHLSEQYDGAIQFVDLSTRMLPFTASDPWIFEARELINTSEVSILTAASWGSAPAPDLKDVFREFDSIWRVEASLNLVVTLTQVKPVSLENKKLTFKGTETTQGISWAEAPNEPAWGSAQHIRKVGMQHA